MTTPSPSIAPRDDLVRIPCVLMRGGTSKGPFFLSDDLPRDPARRDRLLVEALGSGHALQIDGIGGGNPLTSKVAIVGRSRRPGVDVDYLFAQVNVAERRVDTSPNCGNMLSGVAPFAIEAGLIEPGDVETRVRIHNVNTGKVIEARVQTPGGRVSYDGTTAIDGVPGTSAPVLLAFHDAAGAKTGKLLPTGAALEIIDGVDVTLIDAAMPMMLADARSFGLTGDEPPAALDANNDLTGRLERMRCEAGRRMRFRDVASLVIPKPVLLSAPGNGGTMRVRYFMPHVCHTALATTGAVGIAIAAFTPGTIAQRLAGKLTAPHDVLLEHPSGQLSVRIEHPDPNALPVAHIVRTARRLFEGAVLVRSMPDTEVSSPA